MNQRTCWLLWTLLPLAHAAEPSSITVQVYDLANVPDPVLNQAIEIATGLYAGTGLELKWARQTFRLALPGHGNRYRLSESPSEVSLRLLPKEMSDRLVRPGSSMLGVAYPVAPDSYRYLATVLYDRVEKAAAEQRDVSPAKLLGYIIAHELGHLILGPDAHARETLMACPWDNAEFLFLRRGQLRFNRNQLSQLRSRGRERSEAALRLSGRAGLAAARSVATPGEEPRPRTSPVPSAPSHAAPR